MSTIPHDLYAEWLDYLAIEPQGWQAQQIVAQRLSYHIRQAATTTKLRERDFVLRMATPADPAKAAELERVQYEAWGIQAEIRQAILDDLKVGSYGQNDQQPVSGFGGDRSPARIGV